MSRREPTLFSPPAADPDALTDRQRHAYDLLAAAGPDGIDADQLGADIHAARGRHDPDDRCSYCGTEGRQLLRWLADHGLAAKRRKGPWTLPEHATVTARTCPTPGDLPEEF